SGFAEFLHVPQDAQVNGMDDVVRPKLPIGRGPEVVMIPGRSFEQGTSAIQWHQPELAGAGFEIAVEVSRVDVTIWCPFLHRFWIPGDRKFEETWLVPYLDRFDKRPGRKHAMPHGPRAVTGNLRAHWICHAQLENQFLWRGQFRKADNAPPYLPRAGIYDQ